MPQSYIEYTANGSTNQFDITFSYIERTHIKVYVDNVEDTTFTFVNDNRIQTTSMPANGAVVKVDRDTPIDARLVDFQDGSVLTETDLDKSANQNFFNSQETRDEVASKLGQNNAGVYDALNKRIINVGTPTAGTDAANKTYIDTQTNNAFTSATNAATSETNAAASATAAAGSATTASTKATEAATSATNAATSETNAASSASTASTQASTATTQATNAASSASAASTSETNAATSATASANSASAAATSETNAATSATNASTSETNAATSASNAATSETNAANSATTASTQASTATTQATNASNSATAAAGSATAASNSASAASTSASNASTSETNAATSETNAATSETNAATSATNAATSATNAATSATAASSAQSSAESARDSTLAAFDSFDDRYLGAKTSDPSTDNDGNALVAGTLYFNSTSGDMKVYTGSTWVDAYSSGTTFLAKTNNLSDLPNAVTARTNLGVAIGSNVQAHSSVLDATTASYTTALDTKLSGIETGATADQTQSEITALVESAALDMGSNDITTTGKIKFANMYAQLSDLPNATTYHGMFAHVHATGKGYFAHGGNWIELANNSQLASYQTTSGLNSAVDTHLNQSTASSGEVLSWNGSDYDWISNAGFTNTDFDNRLATKDTGDLSEGSNLYYTDERVDDRVSNLIVAGTNITTSYNDTAGTLTINASGGGNTSSPEIYGFVVDTATATLQVTTTNGGNDNISSTTYATFDDVVYASTGFTWSITSSGELRATI